MMKRICYFLISLMMILLSCTEHQINKGVVIDKNFTQEYTIYEMIYNGKTMVPIPYYYPSVYTLYVQNDTIVEKFEVDKETYMNVNISDSINF